MAEEKSHLVPSVGELTPRFGNAAVRAIGRAGLRLFGWRVEGDIPNIPKAVFSAAPHTSNWDFVTAMLAVMAMGVRISFLMKKEAFFWPFKSLFMALGGLPLDRSASEDTVEQIVRSLEQSEQMWVVITPEGTRKRVEKWKTGFLRVAESAKVPVILVGWDYPSRTMFVDKLWHPSGDHIADAEAIRAYISGKYTGRHPERQ